MSRAAVADFLQTPLQTDPCRFFARRRAQARSRHMTADVNLHEQYSTKPGAVHHSADAVVAVKSSSTRTASFGRNSVRGMTGQMTRLGAGSLAAVVVTTLGALGACSVISPDRDAAAVQRHKTPATCRARPDSFRWSVEAIPAQSTVADRQRMNMQPDARDGPIRRHS